MIDARTLPFSLSDLHSLAPLDLLSHRTFRYDGGDMGLHLHDLHPTDQGIVRQIYAVLETIFAISQEHWAAPDRALVALSRYIGTQDWSQVVISTHNLGLATRQQGVVDNHLLSQVVHDIRGGGFTALSLYIQMVEVGMYDSSDSARVFFLTRDHMKIMRNAVRDLDRARQQHDCEETEHRVELLAEKWHRAAYRFASGSTEIILDNHFQGVIAESCLEFAALDRVLYNLINNAARHTSDSKIYLSIFPLSDDHPDNLRFVVYNQTTPAHRQVLSARWGAQLGELFRGGFTTDSSGMGLRICADFVRNAYGVPSFDEGLAGGYFGATLRGAYFVNWVHWPVSGD